MNTIFGWIAAICFAAFVFAFVAGMALATMAFEVGHERPF